MVDDPGAALPTADYRLRRLYHWLTYHRLTIFVYAASFVFPPMFILSFLAAIAILFAPFMLSVLVEKQKRGWIFGFAGMVGVPIVLTFIPVSLSMVHTTFLFLPLVMFYLYCVLLRWAVADWISDSSVEGEAEVEAEDAQERSGGLM